MPALGGINSTTSIPTSADVPSNSTFNDHSARHEDGGADEISIAGLSGTPADLTTHLSDATDAHDASAVSADTSGYNNSSATDVQGVLDDFDAAISTEGGGTVLLSYSLASDITNQALTGGTPFDLFANQSFTKTAAGSLLEIVVRGYGFLNDATGGMQAMGIVVLDSAGTSVTRYFGGMNETDAGTARRANPFGGGASIYLAGVAAGSHTVKAQVIATSAQHFYLRAGTNGPPGAAEHFTIQVIEHTGGSGGGGLLASSTAALGASVTTSSTTPLLVDAGLDITFVAPSDGVVVFEASGNFEMDSGFNGYVCVLESTTNVGEAVFWTSGNSPDALYTTLRVRVSDISAGTHTYRMAIRTNGGGTMKVINLSSVVFSATGHSTSPPAPVWTDWTPVIKAGSTTLVFTTVVARYIKVGKIVHFYIRVRTCTTGGTGVISITGIPSDLQDSEGGATGGVLGSGIWQDEGVEWLHFDLYFASATDWRMKKYNDFADLNKTVGTSPADSFTAQGFIALA